MRVLIIGLGLLLTAPLWITMVVVFASILGS